MVLEGKVALVTGGSGDIGSAIAKALATAGVDVGLTYVGSVDRASSTVDAVHALGQRSGAIQLDQRDPAAIEACVSKVVGEFGRLDILVNNAAWNIGIPFRDLGALNVDVWDRMLETNLRGPYLLARAFAPELSRHKAGRIINIASLAGLIPRARRR